MLSLRSAGPIAGDVQSALLALSKAVKACADGHIPDNLSTVAAQALKDITSRWQSRIDTCFLELRQPSTRTTQKGDHKDALLAGVTLLKMLSKYGSALSVRVCVSRTDAYQAHGRCE